MSEKTRSESSSSSYDSDEAPPLPDEPIPDTLPILNRENIFMNEHVSTKEPQPSVSASSSLKPGNTVSSCQTQGPSAPDDGWNAVLDPKTQSYYFWNSKTNETTWKNPRVSNDTSESCMSLNTYQKNEVNHSSYPYKEYVFTARFNRMSGKWQNDPNKVPENFTEDARALRQQSFYFDVEATAAAHDGRSFRAERQQKRLTKKELANYKKLYRKKKEQRKREWLLDD
ncbi:hypothetical protein PORY_000101 [Pneumocystis oryctolagi]|uniref:Uncharacterized protein n=1 Tax=Pneumocystis oryctolagi TaxID=42067 RepID=A0ACB7CGE4_9ASCO|nr:hypothetical protein PORY_000101 [Pneumocystis oryctolagi]